MSIDADRSLLLCTWGARGACAMSPQGTASRETFHVEPTEKGVHVVEYVHQQQARKGIIVLTRKLYHKAPLEQVTRS